MSTSEPSRCCVCGEPTTKRCQACAKSGFDLFFCSPKHQRLVWASHRRLCGPDAAEVMPFGANLRRDQLWDLWKASHASGGQSEAFRITTHTMGALADTQYAQLTESVCATIYSGSALDASAEEEVTDVHSTPAGFASALLLDIKKYVPGSQDFASLQPLRNVVYHHASVLHALIGHKNAKERPPADKDSLIPAALSHLLNATLPFMSICRSDIPDFLTLLEKNVLGICTSTLKIECVYNEETDKVTEFICAFL